MKRIIVVRHGDYVVGGSSLTGKGRTQFLSVADQLRRENGHVGAILSSTVQRAKESADVLSAALSVDVHVEACLSDTAFSMGDITVMLQRYDAMETVVIVSHLGIIEMIHRHYQAVFGHQQRYVGVLKKGEGFMIDLEQRAVKSFC